jgi:hypothetical protein
MFGGPDSTFKGNLGSALHLEMTVYTDLWQDEQVAFCISRFQTIIPEALHRLSPCGFRIVFGKLSELLSNLTDRLLRLPELVQADAEKTWHPSQQKKHR